MANTIYLRKSRQEVLQIIRQIPAACKGNVSEAQSAAKQLMIRIGMTALSKIRQAFVVKARGGTDECGLKWPHLKKSTVAYSRRHPGVLWPGAKRAPFAPSWMLTEPQRKRWYQLRAIGGAAYAWIITKQEGGKTLIGTYGDTQVEILRDTGLLLNSLSPGVPNTMSQIPNQIFQPGLGEVIIGTNRKWAGVHHYGIPGKTPQRRLWANPRDWTPQWWEEIAETGRDGLLEVALFMLQRKP